MMLSEQTDLSDNEEKFKCLNVTWMGFCTWREGWKRNPKWTSNFRPEQFDFSWFFHFVSVVLVTWSKFTLCQEKMWGMPSMQIEWALTTPLLLYMERFWMESDLKSCWQIPPEKNPTNGKERTDSWGKHSLVCTLKYATYKT